MRQAFEPLQRTQILSPNPALGKGEWQRRQLRTAATSARAGITELFQVSLIFLVTRAYLCIA